jgi:serine/threonine protein kinase
VTKLFDFGLAKELKPKYRKRHPSYPDQDTYKLTGCTGSRRYMAPEVCFSDPYNQKADVYSFGMLLYQVASLVTPFDGFSMGKHEQVVLRGGYRPDVNIPNGSFLKGKKSQRDHSPEGIGNSDVERKNNALASKTKRAWPKELPRLMEECWDYDMRYRPDMKEVSYRLERCVDDLLGRKGVHGRGHHWPKFNPLHHHGKGDGRHSPPVQAVAAMVSKGVGRNGGNGPYSNAHAGQAVYHHHHQANRGGNACGQPMDMQWESY